MRAPGISAIGIGADLSPGAPSTPLRRFDAPRGRIYTYADLMSAPRVVITGLGGVTPIGIGADTIWESACAGRSVIGPITIFDATSQLCRIAGEVRGFEPGQYMPAKHLKRMDDFARYAVAASVMAVDDAALPITADNSRRIGVLLGNNNGGARTIFRTVTAFNQGGPGNVSPFYITAITTNMGSAQVAIRLQVRGPNFTIGNACASGLNAVGEAWRYVREGACDAVIAGGTDALIDPTEVAGFANSRAVTLRNDEPERASRPFDRDREDAPDRHHHAHDQSRSSRRRLRSGLPATHRAPRRRSVGYHELLRLRW